jgi:hypothetical protein
VKIKKEITSMIYKAKYSRKDLAVHKGPLKCRSPHIGLSRKQIPRPTSGLALFRRVGLSKNPRGGIVKFDRQRCISDRYVTITFNKQAQSLVLSMFLLRPVRIPKGPTERTMSHLVILSKEKDKSNEKKLDDMGVMKKSCNIDIAHFHGSVRFCLQDPDCLKKDCPINCKKVKMETDAGNLTSYLASQIGDDMNPNMILLDSKKNASGQNKPQHFYCNRSITIKPVDKSAQIDQAKTDYVNARGGSFIKAKTVKKIQKELTTNETNSSDQP